MRSCASILLLTAATVHATRIRQRGADPQLPFDPATTTRCIWWYDNTDGSIPCEDMPVFWGITEEQWTRWNPSIAISCNNFVTGRSYCVDASEEPTPTTTLSPNPPASTTSPGPTNGIETPQPVQPGMVDNCDAFDVVESGDTCSSLADQNRITLEQFLQWNPEVGGASCNGLWLDVYVCVSVIGHEPTPTNPGNGIETPSPIQNGMTTNCDAFHLVRSGQNCAVIASRYGITEAQFAQWNPATGRDCSGLWANTYACVSVIGHQPTPTAPGNGVQTPTPTQSGMTENCDTFHLVRSGQGCSQIASLYGITVNRFISWNPAVGSGCTSLWANTYACVGLL